VFGESDKICNAYSGVQRRAPDSPTFENGLVRRLKRRMDLRIVRFCRTGG